MKFVTQSFIKHVKSNVDVPLKRIDPPQHSPHPPSTSSIIQTFGPLKQSESEKRERFTPL
jgi:hypothetical protein